MSNWRLDIKKLFANKSAEALGADLGKFGAWNNQLTNDEKEETKPNLAIYFEYSQIGEGIPYLLSLDMQQSAKVPVEVSLHIVFNNYSEDHQDLAYDYADKLTCAIFGIKHTLISGRIAKGPEIEDLNHAANYVYKISFAFLIKEAIFKSIESVDSNPVDPEGNPDTGRKLGVAINIAVKE